MALTLKDKQAIVDDVAEVAKSAISVVTADYRGLTVAQMTQLRKDAREAGVVLRVVRNTLSRRALEGTEFECIRESLTGPLFLAFSQEAPGSAARLIREFSKENDKLNVVALSIGGQVLDASHLDSIANLPTYDEAIAKLMYVMKAPVEQFVRTLAEPTAKFVRTLAAVGASKQQSDE